MVIEQREAPPTGGSASRALRTAPHRVLELARRHPLVVLVLLLEVAVVTQMRNSAFQDEALYLSTGHWLLRDWTGGAPLTSAPADWFTGAPQLHPVLAALLDGVGGLGLARSGSTVFLLLTTVAVAWAAASVVRLLAPEAPETVSRSAAAAALVAASTGPLLALGHFATSDAASFACLAWALALGLHAAQLDDDRRATRTALAVGALLALAVLLKYTTGLCVPFLLLAVLGAGHRTGSGPLEAPSRQALRVAVAAGGAGAALLLVSALTWARPLVTGFLNSTLERQPVMPATSADLAGQVLADAWLPLLLAAAGGAVLAQRLPLVGLALGTGALAPVTAQVLMGENVSLYKASALGVVLGAVAAGTLVAAARAWWASALLVTALFVGSFVGASTAWRLAGNWPNSDALRAVVVPLVEDRPGARVAGDNPEPMEYALWRTTDVAQWSPMYSGAFHRDGLVDAPAYEAAFAAREFDVVFFDGSSSVGRELAPKMADYGFQQAAQVTTPDGGVTWTVWALPAGS